jgi:thymidylate synthase
MRQLRELYVNIMTHGTKQANRTGVDAITLPGAMMQFDMNDGFPAITGKKLAFDAVKGELIGFLQGKSSAEDFRKLGCNIWNANANCDGLDARGNVVPNAWLKNPNRKGVDDLGRIYGVQWRDWRTFERDESSHTWVRKESIDHVLEALKAIRKNPTSRRIIINAWRPDEFDQMALPPCHVMYQFLVNVERDELNLCMYQRSCDMFLGVPFNIASSALMLHIFAQMTGLRPRLFTHFLADAHIYVNHIEAVEEYLVQSIRLLPTLDLKIPGLGIMTDNQIISSLLPSHIQLLNYQHGPVIKAPMNV